MYVHISAGHGSSPPLFLAIAPPSPRLGATTPLGCIRALNMRHPCASLIFFCFRFCFVFLSKPCLECACSQFQYDDKPCNSNTPFEFEFFFFFFCATAGTSPSYYYEKQYIGDCHPPYSMMLKEQRSR